VIIQKVRSALLRVEVVNCFLLSFASIVLVLPRGEGVNQNILRYIRTCSMIPSCCMFLSLLLLLLLFLLSIDLWLAQGQLWLVLGQLWLVLVRP